MIEKQVSLWACLLFPSLPLDVFTRAGSPEDAAEFDYNDFVKREFGRRSSRLKPAGLAWKWWAAGILLLAALIWAWVIRR